MDAKPAALDPIALAIDLIRIDSTSGAEGAVISYLERLLADRNWATRRIPVTAGRDCLIAQTASAPTVTLSTHVDTVPPFIPPRVIGDALYGRGACDAKGIAAAMTCAAEQLRTEGIPVAILFVIGEETVQDGAKAANTSDLAPKSSKVLINGEPTDSTLAAGTKGALWVRLCAAGAAAHSAYPHLGDSAIMKLVRVLAELDDARFPHDPILGRTTVNVGRISGGVADNVVPPSADASLLIRTVASDFDTLQCLKNWIQDRVALEVGNSVPSTRLATLPGFDSSVVAFGTDIPNLTSFGQPYLYGPGSIHLAHRDNEHIAVAELREAVDSYARIARDALINARD